MCLGTPARCSAASKAGCPGLPPALLSWTVGLSWSGSKVSLLLCSLGRECFQTELVVTASIASNPSAGRHDQEKQEASDEENLHLGLCASLKLQLGAIPVIAVPVVIPAAIPSGLHPTLSTTLIIVIIIIAKIMIMIVIMIDD